MKLVRLEISQEFAKIDISSRRAGLKIEQKLPQIEINQGLPSMDANLELGKVELDSNPLKENTARASIFSSQKSFAAKSKAKAEQGVKATIQEGEFLAQQPNPGDLIGKLAYNKLMTVDEGKFGRSELPSSAIIMKGSAGNCEIQGDIPDFDIAWEVYQRQKLELDPPPEINIMLAQEAQLSCIVRDETIGRVDGRYVDIEG